MHFLPAMFPQGRSSMKYQIEGNVLHVLSDLVQPMDKSFLHHLDTLLEQQEDEIVVDLTAVHFMVTWFVGQLAHIAVEAKTKNKHLRVKAKAGGKPAQLIQLGELDRLLELELVE